MPIYNKAYTPANPCFPSHIYAAPLHWSTMSITSIGYGDVVPVRFEEYNVYRMLSMRPAVNCW